MNLTIDITPSMTLAEFERIGRVNYLRYVIARASGHLGKAAALAGLNRTAFLKIVADFELNEYARGLRQAVVDLRHKRQAPLTALAGPGALAR